MADDAAPSSRRPIRDGLLSQPLSDLGQVSLMGARCAVCGETALGVSQLCQNCGSDELTPLPLSREGTLWTYTVVRHRPPGDYRGPDPFVPFALGLVEMPEGIRVMAPIGGDFSHLSIGQALTFQPVLLADRGGGELVSFQFVPSEQKQNPLNG